MTIIVAKRQFLTWHRAMHIWQYADELTIAKLALLGATN